QLNQIEANMDQAANDIKTAQEHLKVLKRNFWLDFFASLPRMFGCNCFEPKPNHETGQGEKNQSWLFKVRSTVAGTTNFWFGKHKQRASGHKVEDITRTNLKANGFEFENKALENEIEDN